MRWYCMGWPCTCERGGGVEGWRGMLLKVSEGVVVRDSTLELWA